MKTDQTARMRRLICSFVIRIWEKLLFSHDVAQFIFFARQTIFGKAHEDLALEALKIDVIYFLPCLFSSNGSYAMKTSLNMQNKKSN